MTTRVLDRTRQSYRHEAFFWGTRQEFVDGLTRFVVEGLAAGEAVMVALVPEHIRWMRRSLGAQAADVTMVDMTELGRNPARIIPAWQQFIDERSGLGRPSRGIGEPIWPSRAPEELLECQLHEALLNLAVDPQVPFWLLCPYDTKALDSAVLTEAHRSHPAISAVGSYQGSSTYGGYEHAHVMFTTPLPEITGSPSRLTVSADDGDHAVAFVILQAAAADVASNTIIDLATTVRRLAVDSMSRGAVTVEIRIWNTPDALICEISDSSHIEDYLVGRRVPDPLQSDQLSAVNHLFDLVQVRSSPAGTTVRLHART